MVKKKISLAGIILILVIFILIFVSIKMIRPKNIINNKEEIKNIEKVNKDLKKERVITPSISIEEKQEEKTIKSITLENQIPKIKDMDIKENNNE